MEGLMSYAQYHSHIDEMQHSVPQDKKWNPGVFIDIDGVVLTGGKPFEFSKEAIHVTIFRLIENVLLSVKLIYYVFMHI